MNRPIGYRLAASEENRSVLATLRYYWLIAKGYRFHPWDSPYIRWRMETFFGPEAADLNAWNFCRMLWRERSRMHRFVIWAEQRRAAQSRIRR